MRIDRAELFVELMFEALCDKRCRRSCWLHPIFVVKFYWSHASRISLRRRRFERASLQGKMNLWISECNTMKAVTHAQP